MKKTILALFFVLAALPLSAQDLPSVKVKDLEGNTVDTKTFLAEKKPVIISFWATWCKPCLRELDAINEVYEEWREETGVTLYAVSVNEGSDAHKAKPVAHAHDWQFEVLLDSNLDFKRAMNVAMVPAVFVLSGDGKIIYQSTGYVDGSESKIIDAIRKNLK